MARKQSSQFCLNIQQNSSKDLALLFAVTAVAENLSYLLDPVAAYEGFFTKLFSKNKLVKKYIPVAWTFHGIMSERFLFKTITKLFRKANQELSNEWFNEFHSYYWAYFCKCMQKNFKNLRTSSGAEILQSLPFYEGMPAHLQPQKSFAGLLNLAKAVSGTDEIPDIHVCISKIVSKRSMWQNLSAPSGTTIDVNYLSEKYWLSIKNTVLKYINWLESCETTDILASVTEIKNDWSDIDQSLLTKNEISVLFSKEGVNEFLKGNKTSYAAMRMLVGCSVVGKELAKRITLSILLDFGNQPTDYQEYLSDRLTDDSKKYSQDLNFLFNLGTNVFKEETYSQGTENIAKSIYEKFDSLPTELSPLGKDYGMAEIEKGLHEVFVATCELIMSYLPVFMLSRQGYEFVTELLRNCHSRLPSPIDENMEDLIDHLDGTSAQGKGLDYFLRHVCTNLLLQGISSPDQYYETIKAPLYSYTNMITTLFVKESDRYLEEEPNRHFVEEPEKMRSWIKQDFPWFI